MLLSKDINRIRGFISLQEADFLYKLAARTVEQFGNNSVLCEIGCFCGKSTISIASALKKKEKGLLYSIDWHEGSQSFPGFGTDGYKSTYEEFMNNLEKFAVKDVVKVIKNKSEDAVETVPQNLHFLWIDGAHEHDAVLGDFNNYSQKIVAGGYLLFHDACWTAWSEPFKVIKQKVLDNPQYSLYACVGNTMIFKKIPNRLSPGKRFILGYVFRYTSGENRSFLRKVLSAILFRLTTFYTIHCHDWRK